MFIPTRITCAFSMLTAMALSGCSTPGMVSSLEDISTDSQKAGFMEALQYRIASVPGWINFPEPGELFFYKPKRKPTSAIGISHSDKSFLLTSDITSDKCDEKELFIIRDSIVDASEQAKALVSLQIQHSLLKHSKETPAESINLMTESELTQEKHFDDAYRKVLKEIKTNGVFVYRWGTASDTSGSFGIDKLAGVSGSKKEQINGFAVICGVRLQTLYIGNDLLRQWPNLNHGNSFDNNFMIVTGMLQGKHIVYGSMVDVESYAKANLTASAEQLSNISATLAKATEIKVDATLARITNLSNTGAMSGIKRTKRDVIWQKRDNPTPYVEDDGWHTFFTVATEFQEVLRMLAPLDGNTQSSTK